MIHVFKLGGRGVVMDVNSGAIHSADDIILDILRDCNTLEDLDKKTGPADALDEIRQLAESGLLFADDPLAGVYRPKEPGVVKALCLHVAHDCNLRCGYCFAGGGEYGARGLMSLETGKAAIDFLLDSSGNRKHLEVDFFGGEPLMNFGAVKGITEYGNAQAARRGKEIRFTLTTNGVLLDDEKTRFINNYMHNVVLSLDGRKEIHDRMRPDRAGAGSYDTVLGKFLKLVRERGEKSYYVRGTFTRENLDFSEDVMHMGGLGFKHVSVEPVVADEDKAYAIRKEDLPRIFDEYEKLAGKLLAIRGTENDFDFFHFMIDLEGGPCAHKRASGCGAGGEYLAVAPDGSLYPCHQFVGRDEFKMGDVASGVADTARARQFCAADVYTKEACRACFAKFYCSGGCLANAYAANKDILKPYEIGCEMQRKRTECAIMIKAAIEADD